MDVFEDEDDAAAVPARYWNHNAAYHRLIRRAVPDGARDLLDVGCGDGRLTRELAGPGRRVLGLDTDAALLKRAAELGKGIAGLEFERGEFPAYELQPNSFDFVCFLASLHHMDQAAALGRAREVLRPGGRLVVIGLARATTVREEVVSGAFAPLAWFGGLRPDHVYTEGMSTVEPRLGWGETRDLARRVLPGRVRYRRRLYFRYSLCWTRPVARAS